MDREYIIKRANELTQAIETSHSTFIFNSNIENYFKELDEIQEQCEHSFYNGKCIYCRKEVNK